MPDFTYEELDNHTIVTARLSRNELLDNMAVGMLSNNRLRGILPFTLSQIDDERYLKFTVSGMQKLTHYFSGFVTRKKFLTVLEGVAGAVQELEDYMLGEDILLLDAEYIWIDEQKEECFLMPMPLTGSRTAQNITGFLKNLMFTIQFNQNENCDYVAKFMSYLNGNAFEIRSFLKLLEDMKQEPLQPVSPVSQAQAVQAAVPLPSQPAAYAVQQAAAAPVHSPAAATSRPAPVPAQAPVRQEKEKKGLFGLFKDNKKSNVPDKKEKKDKIEKKPVKKEKQKQPAKAAAVGFAVPNQKTDHMPPKPSAAPAAFAETTVLSQLEEGTTVLTAGNAARPYLVRQRTNQSMVLDKEEITIGKDAGADFCITDNTAVSRSHALILVRGGGLFLKDNHSTNHTYVNDVMLPPGQEAALTGEEKIQLADEEFRIVFYE